MNAIDPQNFRFFREGLLCFHSVQIEVQLFWSARLQNFGGPLREQYEAFGHQNFTEVLIHDPEPKKHHITLVAFSELGSAPSKHRKVSIDLNGSLYSSTDGPPAFEEDSNRVLSR